MNSGKSSSKNKNSKGAKRTRNTDTDRYLVAEQPGKVIFLSGFLAAVVLGFTVSSLLSPGRITTRLRDAATHINRDVQVDFESAQMSFRNGIFPRWSILIQGVRMQSEQKCWGAPELTVDEMILPLSIRGLISGKAPIPKIYANQVKLRFRGDFKNCDQGSSTVGAGKNSSGPHPLSEESGPGESEKEQPALVRLQPVRQDAFGQKISSAEASSDNEETDVKFLHINSLQLSADSLPAVRTELLNFKTQVKSTSPRVIEVTAQTHLLKNTQVGDYLSHANLFVEYRESPAPKIQTHFFGNWREGHYSLIANYSLDDQLLALETDLRHIPLSQVLEVLKRYQLTQADLDARQIWISGKANFISSVDEIRKSPLQVRDFKLEGDLGEIALENFQINSLDPLAYDPLNLNIRNLKVERLLTLLKRPAKSPIFGSLGQFSGRAVIKSESDMHLTGEHAGLEFVFANKGQSEVQGISGIIGDVSLLKNQWSFHVQSAKPQDGKFIGNMQIKADRDFKNVKLNAKVEELMLAPLIQRLMTNGGDFGPLTLDADAAVVDGNLASLKGLLQVSQMNVEGLFALKSKFQFRLVPDGLGFQYSNRNMVIDPQSPVMSLLRDVVKVVGQDPSQVLKIDQFQGEFKLNQRRDFSWSKTQGRLNGVSNFTVEGSWNPQGQLRGQLQVKNKSRQDHWVLQGTRDLPLLSPQPPGARR